MYHDLPDEQKPERKGKVLFINAINEVERKNAQSSLTDDHIRKIADAYIGYKDDDGFAKVVTTKDIEENNFSLSIPLYVKPAADSIEVDTFTVQQHYESWRAMSERVHKNYTLLSKMIEEGGERDA